MSFWRVEGLVMILDQNITEGPEFQFYYVLNELF